MVVLCDVTHVATRNYISGGIAEFIINPVNAIGCASTTIATR